MLGLPREKVSNLSDWVAAAAAAAAIADPSGIAKTLTAATAFAGQFGVAATGVEGQHGSEERLSHDLFTNAVDRLSAGRDPLLVVLDDFDAARPAAEWSELALRRRLAELMASRPILLVLSISTPDEHAAGQAATIVRLARDRRLADRVPAQVVELDLLDAHAVRTWLEAADENVVLDLISASSGHPGWVAALGNRWRREGVLRSVSGRWEYASGGRAAAGKTAVETVRSRIWAAVAPSTTNFDEALEMLSIGALEDDEFTLNAIARSLDCGVERVVQTIEPFSSGDDPLLQVHHGHLDGTTAPRLARASFTSALTAIALRSSFTYTREQLLAYAHALVALHGGNDPSASSVIAHLYGQAGDHARSNLYLLHAEHAAGERSLRERLDDDAKTLEALLDGDPRPERLFRIAASVHYAVSDLANSLPPETITRHMLAVHRALSRCGGLAASYPVDEIDASALHLLGHAASRTRQPGAALEAATLALRIARRIGDHDLAADVSGVLVGLYRQLALELGDPAFMKRLTSQTERDMIESLALALDRPREDVQLTAATVYAANRALAARTLEDYASGKLVEEHVKGRMFTWLSALHFDEGRLDDARQDLEHARTHYGSCAIGLLCPHSAGASVQLTELCAITGAVREGEEACATGAGIAIWNADWDLAAVAMMHLGQLYEGQGDARALQCRGIAVHYGMRDPDQSHQPMLWSSLATTARAFGGDEALIELCLAMDAHLAGETAADRRELLSPHVADGEVDRLLEDAQKAASFDNGANLVRLVTGIGPGEADAQAVRDMRRARRRGRLGMSMPNDRT